MAKKALGMGLGALFGEDEPNEEVSNRARDLEQLDINLIRPNPDQPRKNFKVDALEELAESIRTKGVLQPIIVEKSGDNDYQIVAGERRFRASKRAGLEKIPVIIKNFSEEDKLEIALIENIQREDLSPIEEALAYKAIMDKSDLNQDQIARRVGKSRSAVANSLRLLKLPLEMQSAIEEGNLSPGHARAILSVVNPADQQLLFSRIKDYELSVRDAEKQAQDLNQSIRSLQPDKKPPKQKKVSPELQLMEQNLIDFFGTKVQLKGTLKKGKIEISYFSMDDLERIMDLLNRAS